jgi:hypothetical protein
MWWDTKTYSDLDRAIITEPAPLSTYVEKSPIESNFGHAVSTIGEIGQECQIIFKSVGK